MPRPASVESVPDGPNRCCSSDPHRYTSRDKNFAVRSEGGAAEGIGFIGRIIARISAPDCGGELGAHPVAARVLPQQSRWQEAGPRAVLRLGQTNAPVGQYPKELRCDQFRLKTGVGLGGLEVGD